MAGDLIVNPGATTIADLTEQAREYAARSRSKNTQRGYRGDWNAWAEWARAQRVSVMPATPQDIAAWIVDSATTHTPGTLTRRLSSVSQAHKMYGYPSPTQHEVVRSVMKGIRRAYGAPPRRRTPILIADLRAAVAACTDDLAGTRDRALLTLGWAGAFRRSEVASIDLADLTFEDSGIVVRLRHSKTDQEGHGRNVGIPQARPENQDICPVFLLSEWLVESNIISGPVFCSVRGSIVGDRLSPESIGTIVKRAMRTAGVEGDWGGHSLRAGMVSQAAREGVSLDSIARQTGHVRLDQVRSYVRESDMFVKNAASLAGL